MYENYKSAVNWYVIDVWEYCAGVTSCWQHCSPGTQRTRVIAEFPALY